MTKINLTRKTINISVSVRLDQYDWLKKNELNSSKIFQNALDKKMVKNANPKASKTTSHCKQKRK